MITQISQRITKKGTPITVSVNTFADNREPELMIEVPGQTLSSRVYPTSDLRPFASQFRPEVEQAARDGFPGLVMSRKASVFVTADELAAWEQAVAAYEALPHRRAVRLRDQRDGLVQAISAIQDQERWEKDRAWDREDEMRAVTDGEGYKTSLADARKALADFDAAHPEVWAAIEAERKERMERFLNSD